MMQKHRGLGLFAGLSLLLAKACNFGPIILVAAFLISPVGPHLRLSTHTSSYGEGVRGCTYLGSRGLVEPYDNNGCPLLLWLDRRS